MNNNSENRICQNCKSSFDIEPEDFEFYEKMKVPAPTFCPRCRSVRRFLFRNDKALFKLKCQAENHDEDIISTYPTETKHIIYDNDYWWSDKWDAKIYEKDYDFSRSFFEQWYELYLVVPHPNVWSYGLIDSIYTNYCGNGKNIYLSSGIFNSEDCFYSYYGGENKYLIDSYNSNECEESYELVNCNKVFKSSFVLDSREIINSDYIYDCVNCQNCFMSSNLRNKNYVFRNTQFSKDEYNRKINEINKWQRSVADKLESEYIDLIKNSIHKYADIKQSTNASGDGITNSVNIKNSFVVYNCENVSNSWRVTTLTDSMDISGLGGSKDCYEAVVSGFSNSGEKFTMFMGTNNDVEYSAYCFGCTKLFGCVGLRNSKYCIFNKQYEKEDYEKLRLKIIEQMSTIPYIDPNGHEYKYGEFFPPCMSPFSYDNSFAPEFYNVNEVEAKNLHYNINNKEHAVYKATIDTPEDVTKVNYDSIDDIFPCLTVNNNLECRKAFKILPDEFEFYKRNKIPFPSHCHSCRLLKRLEMTNGVILHKSNCTKCNIELETPYKKSEPVYCESCYNNEVV